ncbi:RDD family protein [Mycobacterium sp. M26]|uniref:RDD family protein n=1 Tax=Mycobacterium sp. M26 TaxID=1762962 RepID=UPI00073EB598|nr:RDD family protein [Mycobacterium sp. M26]
MTEQPPGPPPGNYPPPPPGAGFGEPPAPGQPIPQLAQAAYTSWFTRVVAWIIDYIPYFIIVGIGYGIEAATQETACVTDTSEYNLGEFCATGNSTLGVAAVSLSVLIGLAYLVWNYGYKQGTTGSSIGKSIMKFKVVSEKTGQPIGFGLSIVRQLAHIVDGIICYIGYLFPLWDAKRQTLADKIMTTVCLPL